MAQRIRKKIDDDLPQPPEWLEPLLADNSEAKEFISDAWTMSSVWRHRAVHDADRDNMRSFLINQAERYYRPTQRYQTEDCICAHGELPKQALSQGAAQLYCVHCGHIVRFMPNGDAAQCEPDPNAKPGTRLVPLLIADARPAEEPKTKQRKTGARSKKN